MRFSLAGLSVAAAVIPPCAAMFTHHGLVAAVLLFPHLAVVGGLWCLVRKRRWKVSVVLVAAYATARIITATVGIPAVKHVLHSQTVEAFSCSIPPDQYQELDYIPILDESSKWIEPPWYYFGSARSPCPFVVTVEYGAYLAPMCGQGGRHYVMWCFGCQWKFHNQWMWLS